MDCDQFGEMRRISFCYTIPYLRTAAYFGIYRLFRPSCHCFEMLIDIYEFNSFVNICACSQIRLMRIYIYVHCRTTRPIEGSFAIKGNFQPTYAALASRVSNGLISTFLLLQ